MPPATTRSVVETGPVLSSVTVPVPEPRSWIAPPLACDQLAVAVACGRSGSVMLPRVPSVTA